MVKPITIHSFVAEEEKIQKLEEKFLTTKVDDSLRKLGKEILKDAPLLKAHGSDLLIRVKEPLDKFAEEKKSTEKSNYNALQRFAFRIAGIFKRGVFATKGEAAEKLSKKIMVVKLKVDSENKGGLLARVAKISVKASDTKGQELLEEHLLKLSDNKFTPLFKTSEALTSKDVVEILQKYDTSSDFTLKALAKNFINRVAEFNPSLIISPDMIRHVHSKPYLQRDIAFALLVLSDDKFTHYFFQLYGLVIEDQSLAECTYNIIQIITNNATDEQILLTQNTSLGHS